MAAWTPRANEIFLSALDFATPAERAAHLDATCGNDAELRRQVEVLLAAHDRAGSFLERPAAANGTGAYTSDPDNVGSAEPAVVKVPGTRIGPYKLLQKLGEGGMGTVYMAEQEEPVRRTVAVKLVKPGMDSRQVVARFEAERQALALMDHPNIAKVLDAGTTETGRPYFVMELVRGVPITRYCDQQHLTTKERLGLFVPVCQALQHAHQKGVIHRDLKPTNVLIALYDGAPVPKVIDFGVAKALHQRLTDRTMFTEFGQVVGTLEYMSPEQAELNQLDIDTRSDVYALGVLLYELLTGTTPLDRKRLRKAAFDEMLRLIREEEPPKPSTRLSGSDELPSIAANRRTEPRKLGKLMRGELDWIVMKALEKDRSRRYETANGLALDVQRYLTHEPVLAGPPGAGYRLRKFARRHRAAVVTGSCFVMVLLVGAVISTWLALRATVAEWDARTAERIAVEEKERADGEATSARKSAAVALAEKQRAEDALGKARRERAISLLRQAAMAWQDNDNVPLARTLLREVPEDLRGWEWNCLRRACQGGYLTLYGHTGQVNGVAFSPDGTRLATASADQTARLWDAATGAQLLELKSHGRGLMCLAFSPDGQRLATGGQLGAVNVWDVRSGTALLDFAGHSDDVYSIAYSPDGQRLATGSSDTTVRVWDAHTGRPTHVLKGHEKSVESVAFSPDSQRLASGSLDLTARVWDANTGTHLHTLKGITGNFGGIWFRSDAVAFSPDGKYLCTGSVDFKTRLWDAHTGQLVRVVLDGQGRSGSTRVVFSPDGQWLAGFHESVQVSEIRTGRQILTLKGHKFVDGVAFSPDGQRLATTGADATVQLWDLRGESGRLSLQGHAGFVIGVAFSPDGRHLATGGRDGTAKIWDATTGAGVITLRGHTDAVNTVAFSPDGRHLATAAGACPNPFRPPVGEDRTAKIWDIQTGQVLRTFTGHTEGVWGVAFSPDGQSLATSGFDRTARVWDVHTGRELHTLNVGSDGPRVWGVAFSPDGRRLAAACDGAENGRNSVRVWDAHTGQLLQSLRGHTRCVNDVTFSPDGRRLATASDDMTVKVWDADTGQELRTLKGHSDQIWRLAFSADGTRLATASIDQTTRVWDAHTGHERLTLKGHTGGVVGVALSRDGRRLATASLDGTARVWDARPVPEPIALQRFNSPANGVAFSPDGRRLATTSADQTASIWDVRTGRELVRITGHTAAVGPVAFSPDGRLLATGGMDRTARIWDADTGRETIPPLVHSGDVSRVAFSPDGRLLLTSSPAGTRAWNARTGQEVADPGAAKIVFPSRYRVRSPDGGTLARIEDDMVYLYDLKAPLDADELAFRQAMARPDVTWHKQQASRFEESGDWFAAAFHLDQVLTAQPTLQLYLHRGRARAELSRWDAARADFDRAVADHPDQPDAWRGLALTQLALKQPDAYRQTCARFVELADSLGEAARRSAVRTVVVGRDAIPNLDNVIVWAWGANDPLLRGAVLYRAGRLNEAAQILGDRDDAIGLLYRALIDHGRGRATANAAHRAAAEAERWLAAPSTDDPRQTNADRLPWDQRVEAEALRAEARALLGPR